jgi:hypothetical protein
VLQNFSPSEHTIPEEEDAHAPAEAVEDAAPAQSAVLS